MDEVVESMGVANAALYRGDDGIDVIIESGPNEKIGSGESSVLLRLIPTKAKHKVNNPAVDRSSFVELHVCPLGVHF
jgi:hypothetical protein